MVELQNYLEAASALTENVVNVAVEGRFRKVTLAVLDYLCKVDQGCKLDWEQKRVLGIILTLGKGINDYYDIGFLDSSKYISLRREFKRLLPQKDADFRKYRQKLSALEKNRPLPSQLGAEPEQRFLQITKYRENVNKLYMAFALSVAFDKHMNRYYEYYPFLPQYEKSTFEGIFNAVMAMQVIDDIVGRKGDLSADRPSFYTAVCSPDEIIFKTLSQNRDTLAKLDKIYTYYYECASQYQSDALKPVLTAVKFTKNFYPPLTQIARKYDFLANISGVDILSKRDRNDL